MAIQVFTVDAFSDKTFRGNTCSVCIFPDWPDDSLLQRIAIQNRFAETAFIVPHKYSNPELHWFMLSQEVDFCDYHSSVRTSYPEAPRHREDL